MIPPQTSGSNEVVVPVLDIFSALGIFYSRGHVIRVNSNHSALGPSYARVLQGWNIVKFDPELGGMLLGCKSQRTSD